MLFGASIGMAMATRPGSLDRPYVITWYIAERDRIEVSVALGPNRHHVVANNGTVDVRLNADVLGVRLPELHRGWMCEGVSNVQGGWRVSKCSVVVEVARKKKKL